MSDRPTPAEIATAAVKAEPLGDYAIQVWHLSPDSRFDIACDLMGWVTDEYPDLDAGGDEGLAIVDAIVTRLGEVHGTHVEPYPAACAVCGMTEDRHGDWLHAWTERND